MVSPFDYSNPNHELESEIRRSRSHMFTSATEQSCYKKRTSEEPAEETLYFKAYWQE
jgi:hypothetical protein